MNVINCRELRERLDRDHPIALRPFDPEIIKDMIERSDLDRRNSKRPDTDRRKDEECSS